MYSLLMKYCYMIFTGGHSWLHEGIFDMGHSSTLRTTVDYLNIFASFLFYLGFLVTRRSGYRETRRRDWFSTAVSGFCALVSIEYYAAFMYGFITKNREFSHLNFLVFLGRGLIWTTLSVSVLLGRSKLISALKSAWWTIFFLLISALNTADLVKSHEIQILEVAPWIANLLLFLSALRNLYYGFVNPQPHLDNSLVESLLVEESEKKGAGLSEASFVSKLLFSWIDPLLRLGNSRPLTLDDIPYLGSEDESLLAYMRFNEAWEEVKSIKENNSVFWAITRVYWKNMIIAGLCALLRSISVVVTPLMLYAFVSYSNLKEKDLKKGVLLVGILIVIKVVESLSYRQFFFYSRRIGMRMRSSLMVAVYQKQLKLSSIGRQNHSTGEIVNYIAVDSYRMGDFPMWFHVGWASVVQIFFAIAVLSSIVGLGVLPGLVPFVVCGLLSTSLNK